MNKYMIVALLPMLFQGAVYGADLNSVIKSELGNARNIMDDMKLPLELDPILKTLVSFSQRGKVEKSVAIGQIKSIKIALEKYRSQQDLSWISWFRGATPQIVKNQIDPALVKVNKVLAIVTRWTTSDYVWAGGTTAATAATIALAVALYFTPNIFSDAARFAGRSYTTIEHAVGAAGRAINAVDRAATFAVRTNNKIDSYADLLCNKADKAACDAERAAAEAAEATEAADLVLKDASAACNEVARTGAVNALNAASNASLAAAAAAKDAFNGASDAERTAAAAADLVLKDTSTDYNEAAKMVDVNALNAVSNASLAAAATAKDAFNAASDASLAAAAAKNSDILTVIRACNEACKYRDAARGYRDATRKYLHDAVNAAAACEVSQEADAMIVTIDKPLYLNDLQ